MNDKEEVKLSYKKLFSYMLFLFILITLVVLAILMLLNLNKVINADLEKRYDLYLESKTEESNNLKDTFKEGKKLEYKITDKYLVTDNVLMSGFSGIVANVPMLLFLDISNDKLYKVEINEELYYRVAVGDIIPVIISEDELSMKLEDKDDVFKQKKFER